MKRFTLLLALCAIVSCGLKAEKPLPDFIHATYSTKELISEEELSCPGYDKFDFIYMMALPQWSKLNFDCCRDSALAYADRMNYATATDANMALVPKMIDLAHEAGSKILLCVLGQTEFIPFMEKPSMLMRLADYLVRIVDNNGYDGIDMDWEVYFNKDQHLDLMCEVRRQLDSLSQKNGKRYFTTSALSIDHVYSPEQAQRLEATHDWINIMSYDMGDGIWGTKPSHNTSLKALKSKIENNWQNVRQEKICLGLANYGFYYRGLTPDEVVPGGVLSKQGRYITYREFNPWLAEGWTEEYCEDDEVSYYFSPDHKDFVTMENPDSMRKKMDWISSQNFRGVFWWEFHHDYTRPCGDGKPGAHALIDGVTRYLGR